MLPPDFVRFFVGLTAVVLARVPSGTKAYLPVKAVRQFRALRPAARTVKVAAKGRRQSFRRQQ